MKNKDQIPSPEEIAEIQEERTISDAEFIKGGAEYKADEKGNVTLEPTKRQIKNIIKEHEEGSMKERLDGIISTLERALKPNKETEKKSKIELPELPKGLENAVRMEVNIGGKSKDELVKEMEENKVLISDYAKLMMDNSDFTTSKKQEHLNLVRISVKDLGFPQGATTDEIYAKAKKIGLELCPAEVGPQLRLQQLDQPNGDWFYIGMKQISGSDGHPHVLDVDHYGDGELGLNDNYAYPTYKWNADDKFVFSLSRKS